MNTLDQTIEDYIKEVLFLLHPMAWIRNESQDENRIDLTIAIAPKEQELELAIIFNEADDKEEWDILLPEDTPFFGKKLLEKTIANIYQRYKVNLTLAEEVKEVIAIHDGFLDSKPGAIDENLCQTLFPGTNFRTALLLGLLEESETGEVKFVY